MPFTSDPVRTQRPLQVYLAVRKADGTFEALSVDEESLSLTTIDHNQMNVHNGHTFIGEHSGDISDNQYAYLVFRPSMEMHFLRSLNISGAAKMSVYEDVSLSSPGTAIPLHNKNRFSNLTAPMEFYYTPSGLDTSGAVVLYNEKAMGGGATAQTRVGAYHVALNEWILKPVWYCISIHNVAGTTISYSYEMEFYYV